jgi:hypothetical protein
LRYHPPKTNPVVVMTRSVIREALKILRLDLFKPESPQVL